VRSPVAAFRRVTVALRPEDLAVVIGKDRAERMVAARAGPAGCVKGLAEKGFVVRSLRHQSVRISELLDTA
jgi:hypothetical protein